MNKVALILLIILVIIITIIFYQIQRKKYNSILSSNIISEEVSQSEESILNNNSILDSNLVSEEISESDESILNSNSNFCHLIPNDSLNTNSKFLQSQYLPYLKYPLSTTKKLTTSNECLNNDQDSCPLGSYKQCSNNYPLPDYNSFEICNCNVNKICPYKLSAADEKPPIKLECPIVFNQENRVLVIP